MAPKNFPLILALVLKRWRFFKRHCWTGYYEQPYRCFMQGCFKKMVLFLSVIVEPDIMAVVTSVIISYTTYINPCFLIFQTSVAFEKPNLYRKEKPKTIHDLQTFNNWETHGRPPTINRQPYLLATNWKPYQRLLGMPHGRHPKVLHLSFGSLYYVTFASD